MLGGADSCVLGRAPASCSAATACHPQSTCPALARCRNSSSKRSHPSRRHTCCRQPQPALLPEPTAPAFPFRASADYCPRLVAASLRPASAPWFWLVGHPAVRSSSARPQPTLLCGRRTRQNQDRRFPSDGAALPPPDPALQLRISCGNTACKRRSLPELRGWFRCCLRQASAESSSALPSASARSSPRPLMPSSTAAQSA